MIKVVTSLSHPTHPYDNIDIKKLNMSYAKIIACCYAEDTRGVNYFIMITFPINYIRNPIIYQSNHPARSKNKRNVALSNLIEPLLCFRWWESIKPVAVQKQKPSKHLLPLEWIPSLVLKDVSILQRNRVWIKRKRWICT